MRATGVVRKIDRFGRINLPKELRSELKIYEGMNLEIFMKDQGIILQEYYRKCVFCEADDPKHSFKDKLICIDCMYDINIIIICPNCNKHVKQEKQSISICNFCFKIIINEGGTAKIKDPNVFNSDLLEKRADFKPIQVGKDIIDVKYFHEDVYNNLLIANCELACRIYKNGLKIGTGVFYLDKNSHILYTFDLESIALNKVIEYLSLWAKDNNIVSIKNIPKYPHYASKSTAF